MDTTELIIIADLCQSHRIERSWVEQLQGYGLVEFVILEETTYVRNSDLPRLEKAIRLHQEMEINPEGIDVVLRLLDRIEGLQEKVRVLENRVGALDSSSSYRSS